MSAPKPSDLVENIRTSEGIVYKNLSNSTVTNYIYLRGCESFDYDFGHKLGRMAYP